MKQPESLLGAGELGRSGLEQKALRLATEKSERSKAFMRAAIGAVAVVGAMAGSVATYVAYENWANDPAVVENWKAAEQAKQEVSSQKLSAEQKEAADRAIAKAQEETAIALRAERETAAERAAEAEKVARPGRLLEQVFRKTDMKDAVCSPYNIELTAKFNKDDILVSLEKNYGNGLSQETGKEECLKNFSMEDFVAPRTLEMVPSAAHYQQLKDMWSLCRNGFIEKDLDITNGKDGSMQLEYQIYAKDYQFSNVDQYKTYQQCMVDVLGSPQIKTGGTPVSALQ